MGCHLRPEALPQNNKHNPKAQPQKQEHECVVPTKHIFESKRSVEAKHNAASTNWALQAAHLLHVATMTFQRYLPIGLIDLHWLIIANKLSRPFLFKMFSELCRLCLYWTLFKIN